MTFGSVGSRFSDSEGLGKLMFRERLSDLPRAAQFGNVKPRLSPSLLTPQQVSFCAPG